MFSEIILPNKGTEYFNSALKCKGYSNSPERHMKRRTGIAASGGCRLDESVAKSMCLYTWVSACIIF